MPSVCGDYLTEGQIDVLGDGVVSGSDHRGTRQREIEDCARADAGADRDVEPEPHAATARMIRVGAAPCAPQAFR